MVSSHFATTGVTTAAKELRGIRDAAVGACVGFGTASLLNVLDWMMHHGLVRQSWPEAVRLKLFGSFPKVLFFGLGGLSGRALGIMAILAALLIVRWTRPLVVRGVLAVSAAWVAAMAAVVAYAIDPSIGLFSAAAALIPAAWLAYDRTWTLTAAAILIAGLSIGFFFAQNLFIVAPEVTGSINPLWGFAPPAVVAAFIAWRLRTSRRADPIGFVWRWLMFWGFVAFGVALASSVALEALRSRPRSPEGAARRVVDEFAYDVRVDGEPPMLLWTNRQRIQFLDNPYGGLHRRVSPDQTTGFPERIWSSLRGGFYIQNGMNLGWWKSVPDGQSIASGAVSSLAAPGWVPAAIAEDPRSNRVLLVSEWFSQYAVVERDSNAVVATGRLSDAIWSWPYATLDRAARVAFISTGMDDGHLYEFDFDSLTITRKSPNLYLYETVMDPPAGLLWGTRPMTGELLGIDTRTLDVRYRIQVEPAVRDIQRDSDTGDLFTCSFLFGDVFQIDRRTLAAAWLGWCGRFCRNLYFDARQRTLWAATVDGVCRIDLSQRPRSAALP